MIEGIEAATAYSQTGQVQGTGAMTQQNSPQQNITTIIQQAEMLDISAPTGPLAGPMESDFLSRVGEEQSFGDKLIQSVSSMDNNYTNIMEHLKDWPDFDNYLSKHGVSPADELAQGEGITHISNINSGDEIGKPESFAETMNKSHERMEQLQAKHDAFQAAGIEYSQDSMRWSMSTEFWLSKVRILTSAVSQVSTGLRTLFNAQ